ncbi:prepilin-type N-terminal cleavage/methylation domain-containing protein [PVC group bacterium]|nr:prepilin-type N-terminal cleavage/methylation domain-containing protein [PVC group bacterium]
MVNKIKRSKKGFTIIEVLVAAVILTLVFGVVYVIFNASTDFWTRGETQTEALQNARVFLQLVEKDLIATINYKNGDLANAMQFNDSTDSDTLSLIIFDSGSIGWGVSEVYYQLSGSVIYRVINSTDEPDATWDTTLNEAAEAGYAFSKLNFEWTDDGTTWSNTDKNWPDGVIPLPKAVKVSVTTEAKGLEKEKTFTTVVFIPAAVN